MKIDYFVIYTLALPMRFSVSHSLARRKTANNILVQAVAENGRSGWGESCPRPYVTGETVETAASDLKIHILPPLIGVGFETFEQATDYLSAITPHLPRSRYAAFCAAELAVLDLAGKTFEASAGAVVGPIARRHVNYGSVIASSEPAAVRKLAVMMRIFGFRHIKVKVQHSLEQNVKVLANARKVLGKRIVLRIDANGAWSADEALRQIKRLARFDLEAVEQPVAGDDIDGMAAVTAARLLPVVADESLCTLDDAQTIVDRRAADVVNIRISKCGGLINSTRILRFALQHGLGCQVGAQVGETAILSAAGRHLATRCPALLWCEGSYGSLLLRRDIAPCMTMGYGGRAAALQMPGLGAEPDMARISQFAADATEVRSYAAV